jgi:dTDP-glucose pyrophosphorylase
MIKRTKEEYNQARLALIKELASLEFAIQSEKAGLAMGFISQEEFDEEFALHFDRIRVIRSQIARNFFLDESDFEDL